MSPPTGDRSPLRMRAGVSLLVAGDCRSQIGSYASESQNAATSVACFTQKSFRAPSTLSWNFSNRQGAPLF
jgi:hypothetical protein